MMRNISSVTAKQVREKLVAQGPSALSDAELLSILLRDGDAGDSAVGLAERLLAHFGGSLARMERCDLPALRMVGGLGIRRAAAVAAALELGRRLRIEEGQQIDSVRTDQDIVAMFQPQLGALPYEEFWAVYLNASNRVIDRMRVSQGGVSATVVDHRLIVKRAVEKLANALVLVHNHPSGNELPSDEDKALTGRVDLAASLFDITLLDHVIVTAGPCYSFRSHGFFDKRPNP